MERSDLYKQYFFVKRLREKLLGAFRASTQNLEKYNPNLINDYIIELRDLSKGAFFLNSIFYAISILG